MDGTKRIAAVLSLCAMLIVAGASGAMACWKPKDFEVSTSGMLCGDPRLWIEATNSGDFGTTLKIVAKRGDKSAKPARLVIKKTLLPGQTKLIGPRWVRGEVKVRVYDPISDSWPLLMKFPVKAKRWGTGGCPANRFGTPDMDRAQHTGYYENTLRR